MFRRDKKASQPVELEDNVVLRVENLSKKFCRTLKRSIFYGTVDIARSILGLQCKTWELRKDEFWALDNISFDLKKGETLGIIGVNGSGKSTLLRMITGIFPPDKGQISHKGRVGALIAVGAGFHPHMTGRENIYLNGTILGMTRKEIDAKIDQIVDFADIGEFLEAPVSTYSSGMLVRLGFAIAVHCEPDILLVDEVLSIGDLAFRNKCMRKMAKIRQQANAIVFVSHNLEHIELMCTKVLVLNKGKLIFYGGTKDAIIHYENLSKKIRVRDNNLEDDLDLYRERNFEGGKVTVNDIYLINQFKDRTNEIKVGESISVCIDFSLLDKCSEMYFDISILNEKKDTDCIRVKSNSTGKYTFKNLDIGRYVVEIYFNDPHLAPGVYFVNYILMNGSNFEVYDHGLTKVNFAVTSAKHFERGIVNVDEKWFLAKMT